MDCQSIQQGLRDEEYIKYISFSTVAFWLYDFLLGFSEEIRMVARCSFALPDIVYFLSRLLTLGHLGAAVTLAVASSNSCSKGISTEVLKWFISLAIPCNTLIFFLRVRALYKHSYIITTIFTCLWACTLSSFAIISGYKLEVVPYGKGTCVSTVQSYSSYYITSPFAALVVFDSSVTFAITTNLLSYVPAQTWSKKIKTIMFARDMGRIPRLILRSGQVYYLVTIGLHMSVVVVSLSSISTIKVSEIALFSCALQNVMACRAHRFLRSGKISNKPVFLFTGPLSVDTHVSGIPSTSYSRTIVALQEPDVERWGGTEDTQRTYINPYSASTEIRPQPYPTLEIMVTEERRVQDI